MKYEHVKRQSVRLVQMISRPKLLRLQRHTCSLSFLQFLKDSFSSHLLCDVQKWKKTTIIIIIILLPWVRS